MRGMKLSVMAVAASLLVAACGGSSEADGEGEGDFRVLAVTGVSGAVAAPSQQGVRGLELAVERINDEGGIDGRDVVLDIVDDQSDPTKAVSLLQEKISAGSPPDLVFTGVTSAESLAMLPLTSRNKILSLSSGGAAAIDNPEEYPYAFQIPVQISRSGVNLPAHLEEMGVERLGLFVDNGEYGTAVKDAVVATLEAADSDVEVVDVQFPAADVDLTVPYQRLTANDVDAVYTDCVGDPCGRIFEARLRAGATDIPIIGGPGTTTTGGGPCDYASGPATENAEVNAAAFMVREDAGLSEPVEEFHAAYIEEYGDFEGTIYIPGSVYDGLRAVKEAVESADDPSDVESITAAMENLADVKVGEWVSQTSFDYSASHSPATTSDDWKFIPVSPVKDGFFVPADAAECN